MSDVVSTEKRSQMMSGIRSKDTKPEIQIRKGLHARGYRYRLHESNLPGKPDLTLKKHNAVIFVHGCFWHVHECHLFKWPKTREDWWREKLSGNVKKDKENIDSLLDSGWRVLIVWECALKGKTRLPIDNILDEISEWIDGKGELKEIQGELIK
jgi:DNA mismatch endonuclease (patch repair protein)